MIYIKKRKEPDWLKEFKRKNPTSNYDSKEFQIHKKKLKEELLKEQKYICAYCCCKIDEDSSHNEHIEPRNPGTYVSKKSLEYTNIVASCNGFPNGKTCGSQKGNDYDENSFISPIEASCEDVFYYFPNGVMGGNDYTIDLLNLNSYKLRQAREAVYDTIKDLNKETLCVIYSEAEGRIEQFINVVKWFIKND